MGGSKGRGPEILTTFQVKSAKAEDRAYKLADSGGLYLLVQPNGSKLWRYKFRVSGVEGKQSLGAFPEVSLAEARGFHGDARRLVSTCSGRSVTLLVSSARNREAVRLPRRSG